MEDGGRPPVGIKMTPNASAALGIVTITHGESVATLLDMVGTFPGHAAK